MKPLRFVFAVALGGLPQLNAAEATGTITGRVFNPATGEYLRNAEIRIEETQQTTTFTPVGTYRFAANQPATVTITNAGTDGTVLIDTVRWIWVGEQ